MNYKIYSTHRFSKELKRLASKFPSLKNEFAQLIESLEISPIQGDSIGNNCYKIRLSIVQKAKEKVVGQE